MDFDTVVASIVAETEVKTAPRLKLDKSEDVLVSESDDTGVTSVGVRAISADLMAHDGQYALSVQGEQEQRAWLKLKGNTKQE